MILVVFGTDEHPFDHALDLIEPLRGTTDLVIQHGHTPARDWADATWHDFLPYETLTSFMREADAIVCHAGVGTIMTVLSLERRPVVLTRLAERGEHVDDHQRQIVAELAPRGFLIPVDEGEGILAAVDEARSSSVKWQRSTQLLAAVVRATDGDG